MHLRKLVLACGFASFALSNYASALGLGEVKLKSTLNQPLSAEVQLLDTKGLSPEQIIVSLASVGDFERNGLDFTHFYSEFKFEVVLDNPSGPVVRITSRNPVREPYLNFLVEARWTSGRLLREYTLLMDLPTFDEAAPKSAVQSTRTSQANPVTPTAAKTADAAVAAEVQAAVDAANSEEKPEIIAEQDQPAKKSNAAADTYGPVGDKDTLWDIALSVRPDSSASVHQTMLALQRLNPEAFIRGNINLLKKGQVLRVPDATEISSVSKSEAVSQFNAQTAEWSGTSTSSTGLGAQLDASTRSSTERVKSEAVAGRVKLEAPTAKDKSASGQGSGANKGSGKALESELASTLEELDKAKSDKTELSSRVRDLEAQVKTMQRLVDVSNEKLRALQLNSAKQPDKADKTAKPADAKAAPEISAPVASQAAASVAASSEAASSAAAVVPKKPVVKPAPVVVEPEKTLVDQLFDNIQWVGLGALGILGVAGFAIMRRRKSQAAAAQSFDKDSDDLFTSEPNFDAFNQAEESAAEPSVDEMALFDEEDTSTVAETGDVVGEADIYIAYGKYDQAEEMLLNGLSKDPASTDIRLKLLEVYSQTQNPTEFDKHYAAILPLATGFALSRAKELRANIPGAGEFSPEAATTVEENLDFNTNFDLDDFDAAPAETAVASTASDDHFDFDLDLDDIGDTDTTAVEDADLDVPAKANYGMDFSDKAEASNAVASLDDEFALDFELDDVAKSGEAEDLSDISLALDSLDDDGLADDIEVSNRSHEDEFSFDFNELDSDTNSLAQEVDSIKSSGFNEDETLGDDFNLEMDVNNLDLAALDNEMASFDAELDSLDDELQDKSAVLASEPLVAGDSLDDFNLGDLDDDLAELDVSLQGESLAELEDSLESDLDDNEFSWEEAEAAEPELASAVEDEFSVSEEEFALDGEDNFDLESAAVLDSSTSLQDLDAELADEGLDDQLNLDEEADIDLDELDVELDEQSFAELEEDLSADDSVLDDALDLDESIFDEGLAAEESLVDSTLSLEDDGHFEESVEDTFSEALAVAPAAVEEVDALDALAEAELEAFDEPVSLVGAAEEELADDDIFEQALSDFSAESLALDEEANMSDDDMDAELDFMADADEAATKLDLARAYMDMGDNEGARDILAEVAHEGNEQQRQEAVDLLGRIDA